MELHHLERSGTPDAAIAVAGAYLAKRGVKAASRSYGDRIVTSECRLFHGGETYVGKGKGIGRQSKTSALFEAIEHMCYHQALHRAPHSCAPIDLAGNDAFLVGGSPDFELFEFSLDIPISRRRFTRMNDGQEVFYPSFLLYPGFVSKLEAENGFLARTSLRKYSTNSGVASGVTRNDAILHALLELVERDALGLALLRSVFRQPPEAVRIVAPDSIPSEILQIVNRAEQETNGQISLFDITSDLAIPAILARLTTSNNGVFFGCGASLNSAVAVSRSVLEAVQGLHVFKHLVTRPELPTNGTSMKASPYQRCFLEGGIYDYRGNEVHVDLTDIPTTALPMPVAQQISALLTRLQERAIDVFIADIASEEVPVVQLISPTLERFFLVTVGLVLAPGGRGRRVLQSY